MQTTQSDWYRSLDAETKSAIRELQRLKPLWNLTAVFFVLLWACLGVLVMSESHWSLRLVGYVVMGMIIHGLGNFMHEGIHGNLFRNRRWDRWLGFLAGVPTLFSVSAYGINHLLHHKHTRTEQDPDEIVNITRNRTLLSLIFYAWFFMGTFIFSFRVSYVAHTRGTRQERVAVVTEQLLIVLSVGGLLISAWAFGFLDVVLHCWIIPLLLASGFANIRASAEHQLTVADHPLRQTRTVTSNPFYSFFNINLNYHLEHHLFPGVPWYNLPKVHRLLLPEYERVGASVYSSYFGLLWDAFRIGVHGRTPDLER